MSVAPPWRPGTQTAERCDQAVRLLLAGQSMVRVRNRLRLDDADERLVVEHLRTVAGTTAARRREALARLLRAEPIERVKGELKLDRADVRAVSDELTATHPVLAAIVLDPPENDDYCPGATHPGPPLSGRVELRWFECDPGSGRVVEFTCACVMTHYELLSYGGVYRICRHTAPRTDVPPISYTSGSRRPEVYQWWARLLAGQAR
ncbi:hypothetical protein [Planotetraspora sp. GP83]|uniref:hypothetical protein n=1 Tax=Planotetraspora sp. GP83 TaxID=3156264 RepID=UPI0035137A7B